MMNDADDRHDLLAHGTRSLLSANASVRQLTQSLWPSSIRLQRQLRGNALATPVRFRPRRFVVRGFAMIFGD